mmetsp:Transcript_3663/g.10599  ORF Transcript_3663/g.10599 Transcript_3663/m.10599 type:complete len:326 (+) Transcript_3663:94-1071(+)
MKAARFAIAFAAFALLAVAAASDDPTLNLPGVLDLTPDNFDQHVNGRKHVLLELYAPWCGHCKRMVPELQKLGAKITSDPKLDSRVVVAKVDADKHRELGERFGVKGFPTVLYLARGKPVDKHDTYQGARTYEAFLEFLEKALENDKSFARSLSMDALATKFLEAAEDGRAAVVEEVKTAIAALSGDDKASGDLYERYMGKAITKGQDYFQTEYDRLERLMGSAASPAKLAEVARKASVLSAFIPSLNTQEPEEAAEEADVEADSEEVAEEDDVEEFEDAEDGEFEEVEEDFPEEAHPEDALPQDGPTEEDLAEEDLLAQEAAEA